MDAVRAFNNELSSLYESKPPVSRAKMAQVTKCAIKAIKFYKHVVQSVEKFIQKCKPEYKVPGLYVIDSIVRQSRHQFGPEKDVFSPRFTKNIVNTFTHLLKCAVEERSRVIRVLNLWQKNCVFPMEIIQPLLDMAVDPDKIELVAAAQRAVDTVVSTSQKVSLPVIQPSSNGGNLNSVAQPSSNFGNSKPVTQPISSFGNSQPMAQPSNNFGNSQPVTQSSGNFGNSIPVAQPGSNFGNSILVTQSSSNGGASNTTQILQQTEMLSTITKLLQQAQEGTVTKSAPESQLQQLQNLQQQLAMQTEKIAKPQQLVTPPIDSNLLAQIQMLTNQLLNKTGSSGEPKTVEVVNKQNSVEPLFNKKLLDFDYGDSDEEEEQHPPPPEPPTIAPPIIEPPIIEPVVTQQRDIPIVMPDQNLLQQIQKMSQQQVQLQSEIGAQDQLRRRLLEQQQQQFDMEIEQESLVSQQPVQESNQDEEKRRDVEKDDRENHDRTSHRRRGDSRERSRSPRRRSRRSRSRSRDRGRDRRRRSRSRDRHRRSRSRERERRDREREREKERERRKIGLPPLKSNNICICSTTIWFGRLTKNTTEDELKEHIEKYGTIRTINMIPPRGCAFVCVTKRRDANKVLDRLKGVKINGNAIKVAWAPGIGVKESVFKDLWDVDLGVTYIPWDKLPKDVAPLLAGGMVDEESLPERLKGIKTGEEEDEVQEEQKPSPESAGVLQEDSVQPQQQSSLLGMPGQIPNIPLPGPNPLSLMYPGGPMNFSGPPPPIGVGPGMGAPIGLGGPSNIGGPNNMGLPNNLGGMGNPNFNSMMGLMGPRPNLPGMGPNLPGMGPNLPGMGPNQPGLGPRPMNMGPQGSMMGGQVNSISGSGGNMNPSRDTLSSPAGVNSPGPRVPFGQFSNMPRFPPLQSPVRMHSFVNSNSHDGPQALEGDSDMRTIAETKEWPPDDEVNAEDESDGDDHPMDSDERMLPLGRQQHMPGSGMPNVQALGNPFGLHGPLLPGQGPPNSMLGIPRAPSPNTGMPTIMSLRMIPPRQQPPGLTVPGGTAPGFNMAPPGMVRLAMPAVGVGHVPLPPATSPHLLPPSAGTPISVAVSVNGTVVVTRPGLPASAPKISAGGDNPSNSSEIPMPEEDKLGPHSPGPVQLMQIHGGNQSPSGPILGRGFAPMTIRPRGGPGILGVRPGPQGAGGFNRFGGPRPMIGQAFGGMDRPPFGNRFGVPLRPPVGFLDQDEREDRDERRPLPRIDVDDHPTTGGEVDQSGPKDIDERRNSNEEKGRSQDVDMRQDIDERPKPVRVSGRQSRWCNSEDTSKSTPVSNVEGTSNDNVAAGSNIADSSAITAPSVVEGLPAAAVTSVMSQATGTTKTDAVPILADVSAGANVVDGGCDAIQTSRSVDASDKTTS